MGKFEKLHTNDTCMYFVLSSTPSAWPSIACVAGGILSRVRGQREAMAAEPPILTAKRLLPILLATSPPVFTLHCQNFTSHANNPASYARPYNTIDVSVQCERPVNADKFHLHFSRQGSMNVFTTGINALNWISCKLYAKIKV